MTQQNNRSLALDTSVLAEGIVTEYLKEKKILATHIIIPKAVLNELEHQANQGKETGFIGLEQVQYLTEHPDIEVEFSGSRVGPQDIKFAGSGAIDNIIRETAREYDATLMTADRVQALVAKAMGIDVLFVEFSGQGKDAVNDPLAHYFSDDTMSVHFKENSFTIAKRGKPGAWKFDTTQHKPDNKQMQQLAKHIVEAAQRRQDGFIEIERAGSTIVQLGRYRVVIVKPPFGSCWEITAVRPVAHLSLSDYDFPEKFQKRLENKAEGILVSGAPGEGKSTFTQALGEFYASQQKIVKTVEAPRDLVLPDTITQYSATHGSPEEIRDVLLLNRPDYTIYDEIRNTKDFLLFADMRLSGVGMIGVVHATSPVDSIQRFINRIELGMVPHIIDTVVFIKAGKIAKVYGLSITVKVPHGMTEEDLARPVVEVKDFYTDTVEYEIYRYSDQTSVIPVTETSKKKNPMLVLAGKTVEDYFKQYSTRATVDMVSAHKAKVYLPESMMAQVIGKGGSNIQEIERELGISLDVIALTQDTASAKGGNVRWEAFVGKKNITIDLPPELANQEVDVYEGSRSITSVTASKSGQVKITLASPIGKHVKRAIEQDTLEIHG